MTETRAILSNEGLAVQRFMASYPGVWHFSGGWAIDLFCGKRRRHHKDIDIAVLRSQQEELRQHLTDRSPLKLVGKHLSAWLEEEWLPASVFQVFAKSPDPEMPDWEFLLEEGAEYEWGFRRGSWIRLPGAKAYWSTPGGIPYLAPEIVLLFKAKHTMPGNGENSIPQELGRLNDEEDFTDALPLLNPEQIRWLGEALSLTLPGHPWLERLGSASATTTRR